MLRKLSGWILYFFGWKVTGTYPHSFKKKILIIAPHTSNWDFPLGLLVRNAVQAKIKFIGKKGLFRAPWGFIMRWLGGIPVDRSKHSNFVRAVVKEFEKREEFCIVMAPEGTRKKVKNFKSGFYYIAKQASLPIIPVKFNYKNKTVDFGTPIYTTDDPETDIKEIEDYFKGVQGKNPELGFS